MRPLNMLICLHQTLIEHVIENLIDYEIGFKCWRWHCWGATEYVSRVIFPG